MTLLDDIATQLAGEFLDDATDRISRIQLALNALRDEKASRRDTMMDVSREVHSIKGMGGSFGFQSITRIATKFEDFIAQTADDEVLPIDDMQVYAEAMAEIIDSRIEPSEDGVADILRRLPSAFADFDLDAVGSDPGTALVVTGARALGRMLARELANCGFQAAVISDPFEAMRHAYTEKPDVILSSAVLPGFSGVDLIRGLLGMRPTFRIPKAVVTSFDEKHAELKDLPKGVSVVRLGETVSDDLTRLLTHVPDKRSA